MGSVVLLLLLLLLSLLLFVVVVVVVCCCCCCCCLLFVVCCLLFVVCCLLFFFFFFFFFFCGRGVEAACTDLHGGRSASLEPLSVLDKDPPSVLCLLKRTTLSINSPGIFQR